MIHFFHRLETRLCAGSIQASLARGVGEAGKLLREALRTAGFGVLLRLDVYEVRLSFGD